MEVAVETFTRNVYIRSSKDDGELAFTFDEWTAFLASVKADEFNIPR